MTAPEFDGVACPRCNSLEIRLRDVETPRLGWTCEACGMAWDVLAEPERIDPYEDFWEGPDEDDPFGSAWS